MTHLLSRDDRMLLSAALERALNAEGSFQIQRWSNPRSVAEGGAQAAPPFLLNIENMTSVDLEAPLRLETALMLEPKLGTLITNVNANVRLGPSTSTTIVTTLPKGTEVAAIGAVRGTEWVLLARGAQVLGYTYAPLLNTPPDAVPELAGGVARMPKLCRRFAQQVTLGEGLADRWEGTACREPDGTWMVVTAGDFRE